MASHSNNISEGASRLDIEESPEVVAARAQLQRLQTEGLGAEPPAHDQAAADQVEDGQVAGDAEMADSAPARSEPKVAQQSQGSMLPDLSVLIVEPDLWVGFQETLLHAIDLLQCTEVPVHQAHEVLCNLCDMQKKLRNTATSRLAVLQAENAKMREDHCKELADLVEKNERLLADLGKLTESRDHHKLRHDSLVPIISAQSSLIARLEQQAISLMAQIKASAGPSAIEPAVPTEVVAHDQHVAEPTVQATARPRSFPMSKMHIEGKDLPLSKEAVNLHWAEFSNAVSLQGYSTFAERARVFATTLHGEVGKHYAYNILLPYVQALEEEAAAKKAPLKVADVDKVRQHFVARFTNDARTRAEEVKDQLLMHKITMEGCTFQQYVSKFEEALLHSADTAEADKIRLFQLGLRGQLVSRCAVDNENRKFDSLQKLMQHAYGEDAKMHAGQTAKQLHAQQHAQRPHASKSGVHKTVHHRLNKMALPPRAQAPKRPLDRGQSSGHAAGTPEKQARPMLKCNMQGHKITPAMVENAKTKNMCLNCGEAGHHWLSCPQPATRK